MKDVYILGIESSCDETSASIVKNGTEEISTVISSQIDIHKDYGGVVPEIASRHHVKNITIVIEECLEKAKMTMDDIDAIAITYGPGLIGSLLIGLEAAKTLSFIHKKPLIPVHHIAGHIYANSLVKPLSFPLLAVVVSGGHTELIEMTDHYKFNKLGGTLDDAIGECYDKVARVIGVNNRDLRDFSVNTDNSRKMRELIPENVIFVSESGIKTPEDIDLLRKIGADAVLIGETLMKAENKSEKLRELKGL